MDDPSNERGEFFKLLFSGCEGKVELRAFPSKQRTFTRLPKAIETFCDKHRGEDVYYGVATRNGKGGGKDNLVHVPGLWVDIDHLTETEIDERLRGFALKPTIGVHSGHGFHGIWKFKEPEPPHPKLEVYLGALTRSLEGDTQAAELARILRIPGTTNHKKPEAPVTLLWMDGKEYDPSDFDFLLAAEDEKGSRDSTEKRSTDLSLAGVLEGERNATAARLAGRYFAKGLSEEEVIPILESWNQKNNPPLDDGELIQVIKSVNKTHNRNHPPSGMIPENEEDETDRILARELAFPPHLLTGVAGDFAKLYHQYIEPPEVFLFFAFLTCLGSLLSGKLTLKSELKPQPRLFTLCLGESADVKKSRGNDKGADFFRDFFMDAFWTCFGIGSPEGLQKLLNKAPGGRLILIADEFRALINKGQITGSVMIPCLNTLFEKNKYESQTKTSELKIENAHLSLLGASTTATYETLWDGQTLDIGFTNRLFLVPGFVGPRRIALPKEIPHEEKKELAARVAGNVTLVGDYFEMDVAEDALSQFEDWYLSLEQSIHARRLDTYAHRLMPLLAINEGKFVVDAEIVDKALQVMDWQLKVRKQLDPIDADNKTAAMEQRIRRALSNGPLSERELKRRVHYDRYGIWFFKRALENLRLGQTPEIAQDENKRWGVTMFCTR